MYLNFFSPFLDCKVRGVNLHCNLHGPCTIASGLFQRHPLNSCCLSPSPAPTTVRVDEPGDGQQAALLRRSCPWPFHTGAPVVSRHTGCALPPHLWTALACETTSFNEMETKAQPTSWAQPSYFLMFASQGLFLRT